MKFNIKTNNESDQISKNINKLIDAANNAKFSKSISERLGSNDYYNAKEMIRFLKNYLYDTYTDLSDYNSISNDIEDLYDGNEKKVENFYRIFNDFYTKNKYDEYLKLSDIEQDIMNELSGLKDENYLIGEDGIERLSNKYLNKKIVLQFPYLPDPLFSQQTYLYAEYTPSINTRLIYDSHDYIGDDKYNSSMLYSFPELVGEKFTKEEQENFNNAIKKNDETFSENPFEDVRSWNNKELSNEIYETINEIINKKSRYKHISKEEREMLTRNITTDILKNNYNKLTNNNPIDIKDFIYKSYDYILKLLDEKYKDMVAITPDDYSYKNNLVYKEANLDKFDPYIKNKKLITSNLYGRSPGKSKQRFLVSANNRFNRAESNSQVQLSADENSGFNTKRNLMNSYGIYGDLFDNDDNKLTEFNKKLEPIIDNFNSKNYEYYGKPLPKLLPRHITKYIKNEIDPKYGKNYRNEQMLDMIADILNGPEEEAIPFAYNELDITDSVKIHDSVKEKNPEEEFINSWKKHYGIK